MISHFAQNAATRCALELRPRGAVGFRGRSPVLRSDVRLPGGEAALESKSPPHDALVTQFALCERFHWLISRQILFRRKEIR
jgi:hypothetical protein